MPSLLFKCIPTAIDPAPEHKAKRPRLDVADSSAVTPPSVSPTASPSGSTTDDETDALEAKRRKQADGSLFSAPKPPKKMSAHPLVKALADLERSSALDSALEDAVSAYSSEVVTLLGNTPFVAKTDEQKKQAVEAYEVGVWRLRRRQYLVEFNVFLFAAPIQAFQRQHRHNLQQLARRKQVIEQCQSCITEQTAAMRKTETALAVRCFSTICLMLFSMHQQSQH